MKELDKEWIELDNKLSEIESKCINNYKRKLMIIDIHDELFNEINNRHQ